MDENAKKILVERNLRLVAHIAKKYATNTQENEEYISVDLDNGIIEMNVLKDF